ncbi:MAG: DUF3105 domain-containing protein [Anaerolineae bacterium]|nr:DUF3105 domain-containing protein [Anaerolineae bacterium]
MKPGSKKSSHTPPPSKMKERRLARQREQRRAQLIRISAIVGAVAGVGLLAYLITSNNPSDTSIEGLQSFPNVQQGHTTEPVTYPQNPPVGGVHNPAWQNCGVYTQPLANENAVHSLEHGAIWITYQPDLPAAEVEKLQVLTRQSGYRLLSPYPDLPSPIVASAWGYQLQLEQADDSRLAQFIENFEQNPNGPEPGAPCTGGVGEPE